MTKPATWDAKPKYLLFKGQTIEFFTRSALATALNRNVGTIRSWELKGVLCHPPIQNHRGHWLYTRSQIEDIVRLAQEEGVFDPRFRNAFSDRFIKEAHHILKRQP